MTGFGIRDVRTLVATHRQSGSSKTQKNTAVFPVFCMCHNIVFETLLNQGMS
jgi:hypothetical protein